MSRYPNFDQALRNIAPTPDEIAVKLGVSRRSVFYYLRGDYLPPLTVIKRVPELDDALDRDLSEQRQAEIAA